MERHFAILLSSLLLFGCGSDSSDDSSSKTTTFNLAISDAPVDGLTRVCVAFDGITMHHSGGDNSGWEAADFAAVESSDACIPDGLSIPVDSEGNPLFMVINLLEYQGESSLQVLSDEVVLAGKYTQMRLSIVEDESYADGTPYSHVVTDTSSIEGITVPSGNLKLDGFTLSDDSVQAYTLEFDMRKSMVLNANGYQIKPRGIRLVNNESVSTISGHVASGSDFCTGDLSDAYIYIYQSTNNYGDLGSSNEPFTSVKVDPVSGEFSAGYIPLDTYDIAKLCDGSADDPEQDDGLNIEPLFTDQVLTASGLYYTL